MELILKSWTSCGFAHKSVSSSKSQSYSRGPYTITRLWIANGEASREKVIEAAKIANAHEFIMNMPQEDTIQTLVLVAHSFPEVKNNGLQSLGRLYTNQKFCYSTKRRRRSITNQKGWYSLRSMPSLQTVSKGVQLLLRTIGTIRNATRIYLLENESGVGSVVAESGSHDELMRKEVNTNSCRMRTTTSK